MIAITLWAATHHRFCGILRRALQRSSAPSRHMPSDRTEFWSVPVQRLFADLQSRPEGLSSAEAARRLAVIGPNVAAPKRRAGALRTLAAQYTSPITMLLLGAAILSLVLGEGVDGTIILGILLVSGLLGFWQERRAASAVERLLVLI